MRNSVKNLKLNTIQKGTKMQNKAKNLKNYLSTFKNLKTAKKLMTKDFQTG